METKHTKLRVDDNLRIAKIVRLDLTPALGIPVLVLFNSNVGLISRY